MAAEIDGGDPDLVDDLTAHKREAGEPTASGALPAARTASASGRHLNS